MVLMLISFFVEAKETLSETAELGKAQFNVCLACHSQALNPAKAPPMFGIQNRYKRQHGSQAAFVSAIGSFVESPTLEAALMKRPVRKLGLMPAFPLGDEVLNNIATYLYETTFDPPCDHWRQALKSPGKDGHRRQVQGNYDKFCK